MKVIFKNKKHGIVVVLLFTLINSVNCERVQYHKKNLSYLNFTDSLEIDVTKTALHGKVLFLNDSLVLYKTSKLIYEDYQPKWLFDKSKKSKLLYEDVYSPEIYEVHPPYKIIKAGKSEVFKVVKSTDTLLFYFETFDEVDLKFLF